MPSDDPYLRLEEMRNASQIEKIDDLKEVSAITLRNEDKEQRQEQREVNMI